MRSSIYSLDFFGLPVTLSYLNDTKYRTNFGLCLSLLILFILMVYVVVLVYPFLLKPESRSFTYNSNIVTVDSPLGFNAGNGNFKLAFGLQDASTTQPILDQAIYGARATYIYRDKDPDTNKSRTVKYSAKIKPCDPSYFSSANNAKRFKTFLSSLYCLSEDQAVMPQKFQNLNISGRFDSEVQGKLMLSIERCKVDCKPDEQIELVLNGANVAVYFKNFDIFLTNQSHPYKQSIAGVFTSIDSDFTKTHEIYMKQANVSTDAGIVRKTQLNQSYTLMDYQRATVSSNRDGTLYSLLIQMSPVTEVHQRTYKKLFSTVAEIGGYMKSFMMIIYLYRPFLQRKYYIELINHLYSVSGGDENEKKKKKKKKGGEDDEEDGKDTKLTWRSFKFLDRKKKKHHHKKAEEMDQLENGSFSIDNGVRDASLTENATLVHDLEETGSDSSSGETELEYVLESSDDEEYQGILKYSTSDWFGILFPFMRGKNHHLYMKGRRIIENNTDITILMRKLHEFEMFKKLMLDKYQEKLFQSLPKPNLADMDISALQKASEKKKKNAKQEETADSNNSQGSGDSTGGKESAKEVDPDVHEELKEEEEHQEIKDAYKDLKKRKNSNHVTKKLLKAFEDRVMKSPTKKRSRTGTLNGRRRNKKTSDPNKPKMKYMFRNNTAGGFQEDKEKDE